MRHKYPKTYHFEWSDCIFNDDKLLKSLDHLEGMEVVVSIKMDGENTTMAKTYCHARSAYSGYHPSRSWVLNFHGQISYLIPENLRIVGENLYAQHSIKYDKNNPLKSYFYCFSIWRQDDNTALSWDETVKWCEKLGLAMPEVLYRGVFDNKKISEIFKSLDKTKHEGIVVRVTGEIPSEEFSLKVGKAVRKDHVQTDTHWMNQEVIPNTLDTQIDN